MPRREGTRNNRCYDTNTTIDTIERIGNAQGRLHVIHLTSGLGPEEDIYRGYVEYDGRRYPVICMPYDKHFRLDRTQRSNH